MDRVIAMPGFLGIHTRNGAREFVRTDSVIVMRARSKGGTEVRTEEGRHYLVDVDLEDVLEAFAAAQDGGSHATG